MLTQHVCEVEGAVCDPLLFQFSSGISASSALIPQP